MECAFSPQKGVDIVKRVIKITQENALSGDPTLHQNPYQGSFRFNGLASQRFLELGTQNKFPS